MGVVVIGKIESGKVKKGQSLMMMPNRKLCEVSAIFLEDEEILASRSGDNVRIRLKNIEEDVIDFLFQEISPGFILCNPNNPVHVVSTFEAQLAIIEHKSIVCAGYGAVMHVIFI